MRILMVGAGAVGGQFGAYLHEQGADVQFLLRPARKTHIDQHGLTLNLPNASMTVQPRTLTVTELNPEYNLIILGNKAYALDGVITDIKQGVGAQTFILPLLNGLRHLDQLDAAFGKTHVLGGIAKTVATLDSTSNIHVSHGPGNITVGARFPEQVPVAKAVFQQLHEGGVDTYFSESIMDDMWDKFCRMASLGAANCLLGGTVAQYMRSQAGGEVALQLFKECTDTAQASGYPMQPQDIQRFQQVLTSRNSTFNSSMYRDMQAGLPVEGDHLVGDMMRRGESMGVACPMLKVAHAVLETYSARR